MIMDIQIVKRYQQEIKQTTSKSEKDLIASKLHAYIATLPNEEQKSYKDGILTVIESKFEVMDKLIAAYEAIKRDDLVLT